MDDPRKLKNVRSCARPAAVHEQGDPINVIYSESLREKHGLVVPPLEELAAIAVFTRRETARSDALVTKVPPEIARLKEAPHRPLSAAVTGKIDVREGRQLSKG